MTILDGNFLLEIKTTITGGDVNHGVWVPSKALLRVKRIKKGLGNPDSGLYITVFKGVV